MKTLLLGYWISYILVAHKQSWEIQFSEVDVLTPSFYSKKKLWSSFR